VEKVRKKRVNVSERRRPYTEEDHNCIRVVRKKEVTRMPLIKKLEDGEARLHRN